MEILARYLVAQKDKKQQLKSIIFPRYHQLDATRKLVAQVLAEGPGGKFLIQHSAGSGKTNSIAWAAHFLADLHDAQQQKLFQSVLVVSDRTVLDAQLQEADFQLRAHHRGGGDHHRGDRRARVASWRRRWPAARRSWCAPSRPSPSH
ncbi:MAG: DEAD/DEAH box helicase family protein [Pseudomonas sp.]